MLLRFGEIDLPLCCCCKMIGKSPDENSVF